MHAYICVCICVYTCVVLDKKYTVKNGTCFFNIETNFNETLLVSTHKGSDYFP